MTRVTVRTALLLAGLALLVTSCATPGRLVDRAGSAAEREAARRVDRGVAAGAQAAEDAVVGGDDDATPPATSATTSGGTADPKATADDRSATAGDPSGAASENGESAARNVSSNYDYTRGGRPLYVEDYSRDVLGDFPRRYELLSGNWDIVEVDGERWLRGTGNRGSSFQVVLPEELPESFTIEYQVMYTHGNQVTVMGTSPIEPSPARYPGTLVHVKRTGSGAWTPTTKREVFARPSNAELSDPTPVKVMVDGNHMKIFVGGVRVSNVPNAEVLRSDRLHFEDLYFSNPENPLFIGAIRVDVGGLDLYGAIEREGRVALEGIYFDTGSDALRPESHDALTEVASMMGQYPDLKLSVEGHTDSEGDDAFNLDLSNRRAASVRRYLVDQLGVRASQLASRGHGETQPVASNETPEGRQQNRRVELVRIP